MVSDITVQNELNAIKMVKFDISWLLSELNNILDALDSLNSNWSNAVSSSDIESIKALVPTTSELSIIQEWVDSIAAGHIVANKIETSDTIYL